MRLTHSRPMPVNRLRIALCASLLAVFASAAPAAPKGDAAAGAIKSKPCAACHGADGDKTLDGQYPRIAGQYADYLVRSMQEYRNGRRDNAIMAGFVKELSDQDLADLASFYAQQDGQLEDLSHLK